MDHMTYAVFAGEYYYPSGGWDDFKETFATMDEAAGWLLKNNYYEWWQIVDLEARKIVHEGSKD